MSLRATRSGPPSPLVETWGFVLDARVQRAASTGVPLRSRRHVEANDYGPDPLQSNGSARATRLEVTSPGGWSGVA